MFVAILIVVLNEASYKNHTVLGWDYSNPLDIGSKVMFICTGLLFLHIFT